VLWSRMYSRIGEDCKKVEGWLADWGIGEGEEQTWLPQSRSSLFCIWRMSYGASSSRPSWSFCTRPICRINTRHLHSRNRTHSDRIDARTRNELDPHFSVPNPAPTVVLVWGDDRGKRRARSCPMDLNGTARRTPRLRVHLCIRETLVVLGDVGVERWTSVVLGSRRSERRWLWSERLIRRGCGRGEVGSAHGLVADVGMRCGG
jgi:hypothetical protein